MSNERGSAVTVAAGLAVAGIFGFSFIFTKRVLGYIAPPDLLALRFVAAASAMTAMAAAGLIRIDLTRRRWVKLLPLAVVQPVLYFLCESYGVKLTAASEAGAIIGTIPVAVAVLAAVCLRERPGALQIVSILASSAGVAIMAAGGGFGRGRLAGILLLFGAVLAAGIYSVLSRSQSREFKPMEITMVMMWTGACAFTLMAFGGHWLMGTRPPFAALARPAVWIAVLYLGLLSSVAAFFLVNFLLGRLEAARTMVYTNLTTLVSVLAGVFVLGESFRWHQGIGGALILLGVFGINRFRPDRAAKAGAEPAPPAALGV
ncbi:MAG: DMT family transporter [Patescibacteria group bacterium]